LAGVTVRELRKSFGAVEVIHGVDVDIEDGEFAVLVGPSGCGKSTLLRMIARLESITGGTIRIGERVVNDLAPAERDIAVVFQSYALYPHKTVRANMGFAPRRAPKDEIAARVNRAAEILGLTPFLDRYPRELSGGRRRRVAMGRAIVRDPQVFPFDEPLSDPDAKLRVHMRAEIRGLHQRLKTTTASVTREQIEAMTTADEIMVMQAGRIEQVGSPLELYDRPRNLFVAEFIGSPAMNLIRGEVRDGSVEADGLKLPGSASDALGEGREVVYGIPASISSSAPRGCRRGPRWSSRRGRRSWSICASARRNSSRFSATGIPSRRGRRCICARAPIRRISSTSGTGDGFEGG
jgi:multiple sugar transport system ATP-binding protein